MSFHPTATRDDGPTASSEPDRPLEFRCPRCRARTGLLGNTGGDRFCGCCGLILPAPTR